MNQSTWLIDTSFKTVLGVTKASTTLNRILAPANSTPVALLPKYQGHIEKAWLIESYELVVCTRVLDDKGKRYRYDLYSTTDVAMGFYLKEVSTIMDTYIVWNVNQ